MKRYIGSLLLAMVFALGLLPVTALAEGINAPNTLYVGNQQIISGSSTTYWTTNDSGALELSDQDSWNVKYEPSTAALTLKDATIETTYQSQDAVIYADSAVGSAVSLTINLEGTNKIECDTAFYGIYVNAEMASGRYGTNASLTITGTGSLSVSGSNHGIYVKSGTGNASLTIANASVNANTSSTSSGYAGVYVASSTNATDSPELSLAVKGGSLTANGGESSDGIQFYVGASAATSATTSLTVSNNAIVDAKNGGISAKQISNPINTDISATGTSGGIVFDDKEGTVYGEVTLDESLTIDQGETLTIPDEASLNANGKLTNNGTILASGGTVSGDLSGGTKLTTPTISTQPTGQTVTAGSSAEFSVAATGENLSYQWQQSINSGSSWTDISDATTPSYTTVATTAGMNGCQYRCVVTSASGVSVISSAATLKVVYTVTVSANPVAGGTVEVKDSTVPVTVAAGNEVTLNATANNGYHFDGWTVVSGAVHIENNRFTMPAKHVEIQAAFKVCSYEVKTWNWSADGKSCSVELACKYDPAETETMQAVVTSKVKTPATCQAKGVTTYTATVELDGTPYTSTKDVTDIPLADHLVKWEGDYPATCDRNGREGTATCVVCGRVLVEDKVIPAPGHKYGEPVWTWSKDGKSCTVTFTCSVCGYASENKATVTTKTSSEATCTRPGTATQQAQIVFNGNTYTTTKGNVTLAALGHNYKDGKCTRCGQADPNAKPAATASVTTGANGKWQTGSTQGLSFTYAGEGKFLRVQVNGATLKEDQYQQQGNTVTLTQEYLKTLDPGSYTLVIALENSSAKTTFTVEQSAQTTPLPTPQPTQQPEAEDPGKSGNLLWIVLGGGAAVLLIGGVVFLRFKRSLYD